MKRCYEMVLSKAFDPSEGLCRCVSHCYSNSKQVLAEIVSTSGSKVHVRFPKGCRILGYALSW